MGLDTSHGAWAGSYSWFNKFRAEVAKAAGWPVKDGIFGRGRQYPVIDEEKYSKENYLGAWGKEPDDVLLTVGLVYALE